MKTMKLFLFISLFVLTLQTHAQVSVSVNIGSPPVWAPAAPAQVEYYYLPDIQVYYDVPARSYIYFGNGRWRRSPSLPQRYRGYDLYHGHTVYLNDYHGRTPYVFYKQHKEKYRGDNNWKPNGHDNGNHGNRNENDNHDNDRERENHENDNRGKGNHDNDNHGNGKGHGKR